MTATHSLNFEDGTQLVFAAENGQLRCGTDGILNREKVRLFVEWIRNNLDAHNGDTYVDLIDPGNKKIAVIKLVRAYTNLGLKDAKDLVESRRPQIFCDRPYEMVESLRSVGARADVVEAIPTPEQEAEWRTIVEEIHET